MRAVKKYARDTSSCASKTSGIRRCLAPVCFDLVLAIVANMDADWNAVSKRPAHIVRRFKVRPCFINVTF
jgi:hypothetical protein